MAVVSDSIPKYCHHKASGQAFIQIQGKRHYLGNYGTPKSKEAYARFVAELAASPVAPAAVPHGSAAGLTVVELADAYQVLPRATTARRTARPAVGLTISILSCTSICADLYGRTPAADFGPKAFKAIRQTLVDAGNSRPYVNKLMPIVTSVSSGEPAKNWFPPRLPQPDGRGRTRKGRTTAREPAPSCRSMKRGRCHAALPAPDRCRHGEVPTADRLPARRSLPAPADRPGPQRRSLDVPPASHKTEHHGQRADHLHRPPGPGGHPALSPSLR